MQNEQTEMPQPEAIDAGAIPDAEDARGYLGPAAAFAVAVGAKLTADYIAEAKKDGEYGYFAKLVKDWWNS